MLTGGVPKYIDLLMEAGAVTKDKMLDMATRPDSPFIGEGKELLVSEFGKEYGTYFSILQLIASGKTTQSEIDSIIKKNRGLSGQFREGILSYYKKQTSVLETGKPEKPLELE